MATEHQTSWYEMPIIATMPTSSCIQYMPSPDVQTDVDPGDQSGHTTDRPACRTVIHVINGEFYSGAERVQDLLAQQLPKFGFGVTFACVKPGQFRELRKCHSARIVDLPMRWRIDLRPVRLLARLVRDTGAELLHAHTPRSLMVARMAAWLTNTPLVYHVHSPTSRDTTQRLRNWLNNSIERFSLSSVDRLITVSGSLAEHMQAEGVDAARITSVPNGVPEVQPPPPARMSPNGIWTLGTVALFRPRKGLEVLLDAVAQLNSGSQRVCLRAIGAFESEDYKQQILHQVARLGIGNAIHWTGFTRDVTAELAKLDIFVLPSLFGEGLPMVVLEAMAAGVPVVATRVEGVPEAIRDHREGLLAEPGDSDDLAQVIHQMCRGRVDWQAIRTAAMQRHHEHFSDHHMAEKVAAVYREVLATKRSQKSS